MAWYFDFVKVYEPCVTWEFCGDPNCGYSTLAYWQSGKKAGLATVCGRCDTRNFTIAVVATTN